MRPRERHLRITDIVRSRHRVTVDELAQSCQASAETIRRDLSVLSSRGKLQKIHGGAVAVQHYGEGPFAQRMQSNAQAKRLIAQKACALISPGDTLFIDTGSTTLLLAEELQEIENLTVITNSAEIAKMVTANNPAQQIYLLGGAYHADNRQTVGAMAIEQIGQFQANLALLTAGALGADGVMDYSADEAQVARAMMRSADKSIVLVDSSKFDRIAPFVVSDWSKIDSLVCDQAPSGRFRQSLQTAQTRVVC